MRIIYSLMVIALLSCSTPLKAASIIVKNEGFSPAELNLYKVVIVPEHADRKEYLRIPVPKKSAELASIKEGNYDRAISNVYLTKNDFQVAVCATSEGKEKLFFSQSLVVTVKPDQNNVPECVISEK
ncbi:hypothetical protein [Candidatus Nucleicultrix amoebiphila]|uniref:Uncharacterized protein n=1 Tax=Candidatus Nucleicultrix amoebiphila FS5 TaxID=1414854 RepID=A0A1W6N3B0_9PROT|nr:hypothetical protein [Candidatus Nucleicultrix amoebiphila]ARN84288.1 hypothetical protein GQ61_01875 [Candidatus Nucleicultrix amoebiphila FS5]